ncbi:MAG: AraC family transcriptional regulator [Chitinophagaceae bacterium]
MYNLYTHIATNPDRCRRFTCGESLFTIFNCRLENKYEDLWSHYNYIVYVIEGRKIWHTAHGSYDLKQGSCVFVRKGAAIVEQFFDTEFCFVLFFIPDDFICDVLKGKSTPIAKAANVYDQIMIIDRTAAVDAFYQSMIVHFDDSREPDQSLLELKFRELILTIAGNTANGELLNYFSSLLLQPQSISLQRVMEENFQFNLKLEEFARLSSRSLSAFKREFLRLYNSTPGKWIMEKRLNHALHLLSNMGKTVSEASFESGFESASHFSRAFRQRFGSSPIEMKQSAVVS